MVQTILLFIFLFYLLKILYYITLDCIVLWCNVMLCLVLSFIFFFLFFLYSFCYSFAFIWLTICNQKSVDDGWPFAFDTSILTPKNMKKMKKARLKLSTYSLLYNRVKREEKIITKVGHSMFIQPFIEWINWMNGITEFSFNSASALPLPLHRLCFALLCFAQIGLGSVS